MLIHRLDFEGDDWRPAQARRLEEEPRRVDPAIRRAFALAQELARERDLVVVRCAFGVFALREHADGGDLATVEAPERMVELLNTLPLDGAAAAVLLLEKPKPEPTPTPPEPEKPAPDPAPKPPPPPQAVTVKVERPPKPETPPKPPRPPRPKLPKPRHVPCIEQAQQWLAGFMAAHDEVSFATALACGARRGFNSDRIHTAARRLGVMKAGGTWRLPGAPQELTP